MDFFTNGKFADISTGRVEAFSDGVIAILITVMVFDLKIQEIPFSESAWAVLYSLIPKFASYALSFLVIAIMWVNHHQLFHQIRYVDGKLLWYAIHLLFWMSVIPFGTNFIGANPMLGEASFCYGIIFFMCAWSFTLLRNYVVKGNLLHRTIDRNAHVRISRKNRLALAFYLSGALLGFVSPYISYGFFLLVPAMYFIPEKIAHLTE